MTAVLSSSPATPGTGHGVTHVLGAGMAGLAAATRLIEAGRPVRVYEAAPRAGGRCRSYHDQRLDREIDNGSHLILGANREVFRYLQRLNASDRLMSLTDPPRFGFRDIRDGRSWSVAADRLPRWLWSAGARIPGASARHYLALFRFAFARAEDRVADVVPPTHPLYEALIEPLSLAILNTAPNEGSARLLWAVLKRTLLVGGPACTPYLAKRSLDWALIAPALAQLGETVRFGCRVRGIEFDDARAAGLELGNDRLTLPEGDSLIVALPPGPAADLLPGTEAPTEFRSIVNAHYRLPGPAQLPDDGRFLGLIGSEGHWLFAREDIVSVTVSAGDRMAVLPHDEIASRLWSEIAPVLGMSPENLPPCRVIVEKRATFAQTPAASARRPGPNTDWRNVFLAGDWTDTCLPATIEGAVLSGHRAAEILIAGTR